jgi:hypothetical protein
MLDYRIFGWLAENYPNLPTNKDWEERWYERHEAVRRVLGETVEPGMVYPFSWKDYILPGACALSYRQSDATFLYMTLGLTQPLRRGDKSFPWEFAVRVKEHAKWPVDLLYQLLSQWLWEKGEMWFGYRMPLKFFIGHDGNLWPSISDRVPLSGVVGTVRRMHLWTDWSRLQFSTASDTFRLLLPVAVTEDEEALADETTPAHLMLLLRRMGVPQICDPNRRSVLELTAAKKEWVDIKRMPHDDAFNEVQAMPG